MDSNIWQDQDVARFWVWCLLKATHSNYEAIVGSKLVLLQPGQFLFGRTKAAEETGLSEQKVRRCVDVLTGCRSLTVFSTKRYSVITIHKWLEYQEVLPPAAPETTNSQPPDNLQITNRQPTDNQLITTYKNDKKGKNEKNGENISPPAAADVSGDDAGVIYSRRMVREAEISRSRTEAGKAGGLAKRLANAKQNPSKTPSKRLATLDHDNDHDHEDDNGKDKEATPPPAFHDSTLAFCEQCNWLNIPLKPWFKKTVNAAFVCGATLAEAMAVVNEDKSRLLNPDELTKLIIDRHKRAGGDWHCAKCGSSSRSRAEGLCMDCFMSSKKEPKQNGDAHV